MQSKKISVVILTYNSEKDIMDCLASVLRYNDIGDALEIIVVDNNSPQCDEMFSKIETTFGECIVLIKNQENKGYGQGNNVGILASTAPYILIMNPDVRLTQPIFATVCRAFDGDANVVMYGMRQMLENKKGCSISWTLISNAYIRFFLGAICNRYDIYISRFMYIAGACFFLRKDTFEKVGLFDEHIFMYGEEDDIHRRLLSIPHARFIYSKKLSYLHLIDSRQLSLDYLKKRFSSTIYLYQKNGVDANIAINRELLMTKMNLFLHSTIRKSDINGITVLKNWVMELKRMLT